MAANNGDKKILFIGHEASRTGAPIVLLHLLRWIKENSSGLEADLLLLRDGELKAQYSKVSNVYVLPERPRDPSLIWRAGNYLKKKAGRLPNFPRLAPFSTDYDAVVGNTVVTLDYLGYFCRRGVPTLCWIHELDFIVRSFFTDERFRELSENADQFIVVSKAVESMLRNRGIEKTTHLIYGFPPSPTTGDVDVGAVKRELGIPANAFVVGGSGTFEWKKGIDLFLQIAERTTVSKNIYFVWVGGNLDPADPNFRSIDYDFRRLRQKERVIFTGAVEDTQKYFATFNVFALTSREDPFPLVGLEAASLGKPVICFENAGGMPEFVETDAGCVVPYGDVEAFSERIRDYAGAPDVLAAAGESARVKANTRFSQETACKRFCDIISNL